MLRQFDPTLSVEIHTNASGVGVGSVLFLETSGGEAAIAHASETSKPAQQNYSATETELFAVVLAIKNFQQYLSGPFNVITDHAAIIPLLKTKNPVNRLAKWLLRIFPYVFQVVYRRDAKTFWLKR